jgi:hypothetical protein
MSKVGRYTRSSAATLVVVIALPLSSRAATAMAPRASKRYEPVNPPVAYQRDGSHVGAVLKNRNDLASICLMGSMVEITAIWPD